MIFPQTPNFFSKNFIKNIIFIFTAWISLSLWIASTISTPKKIENIEERIGKVESNFSSLQSKTDMISNDVRDIKNILMNQ